MTSILLVDDHVMVRQGLRCLLESQADMHVIGEAGDGEEALEMAARCRPDVVLMDVRLPGMNGIDATRRLVERMPGVRVLAVSGHHERLFVEGMLAAGAAGYVVKESDFAELTHAIRAIILGRRYLSPTALDVMLSPTTDTALAVLTLREREVLELVAEGYTSREIGQQLGISLKTVESHRARIMKKLEVRNAAELTRYAIRAGLSSAGS